MSMIQRPNLIGQQFGSYRLLRRLGAGGFAEVYLGEHIHLGTQVAIKVLHTQLAPTDIDSFRMEARTIAHLIHPHIIRVLDFNVAGSTPFLVMDYAASGTMRERHPRGSIIPLSTIVTYIQQIADALQYAHDEKLIHRDIKPENILLDQRNNVLLSDFGIALVAQSSRYQNTQDVIGTAAYMSPEQIQGKPRPASDQYSLGIVVYEWLSGTRPFEGSFTELCAQHMFAPPPPLREKVPIISPEVEHVVMTALAKDPKQRFGNISAFATALQQACQSKQAQDHSAQVWTDKGNAAAQKSNYKDAADAFAQAVSSSPNDARARYNLALAQQYLGDAETAVAGYRCAIDLDPQLLEAYINLGNLYGELGLHEEALETFQQALELEPENDELYLGIGDAYSAQGLYQDAIQAYRKTLLLNSENSAARDSLRDIQTRFLRDRKS
jgi:serine/threonine protein kinase